MKTIYITGQLPRQNFIHPHPTHPENYYSIDFKTLLKTFYTLRLPVE